MRVVFVVGHALGHVGRALSVARALRELQPCDITFVGGNPGKYFERYVSPDGFKAVPIDSIGEPSPHHYATWLARTLSELDPGVIVFDLSPFPWLLLANVAPIPQVYLTNYFLTGIGDQTTAQDAAFAANKPQINAARQRAGLPVLGSVRELYEKDRIILADPPQLLPQSMALPENYTLAGAIWWEPECDLPKELLDLNDILYISLGSTGTEIPGEVVARIAAKLDIRHVVCVSARKAALTAALPVPISYHTNVPGSRVLRRSLFAVTQGGAGSCYQALGAGVPIGIWPTHRNHYLLGKRLAELGVACMLDADRMEIALEDFQNARRAVMERMRRFGHMDAGAASQAAAVAVRELF